MRRTVFVAFMAFLVLVQVRRSWAEISKENGTPAQIIELVVRPSPLVFSSLNEAQRVLVFGIADSGEKLDLAHAAEIKPQSDVVKIGEDGFLQALRVGETKVLVSAAGRSVSVPVTVKALDKPTQANFLREVLPALNKIGCTQGTCHGAAKGKNGFKLSLRGYDPEFDYHALLYDLSGRRFNRANPARSLMLAKPTQQVAHGGGLRIEVGSRYYNLILNWISSGAPFGDPLSDKAVKLEVLPEEIFMHGPGRRQEVVVRAHYGDNSSRDVTREVHLGSSNTETVSVDEHATVQGLRKGEATLLVRYEGQFARVPITVLDPKTGFRWTQHPQHNFIDELIDAKLKRIKIQPSALASDAEFLRRVYLDLTGQIPKAETVSAFLADRTESRAKRSKVIDELLGSSSYVDYWTLKWGDLLRSNRKYMSDRSMWAFREWLRQSMADNKPYDRLVRELLTAKGSTIENPAANFFLATRDAKHAMETTTQLFLGIRMVCAQCHDHPFERWTQNQYYQMSAFFGAVGVRPGFESGEEIVYLRRIDSEVKHPKSGQIVEPQYLVASLGTPPLPAAKQADQRTALVDWLTSKNNPFFARAIVNRVWSYFFGRGIIEPVDDTRASNPPVNEPLLNALARDFTDHGFDLKHLIRTITNSRTYQASFRTNEWNADDLANFSHQIPRRLSAEQLADAISTATGSKFKFPEVPEDFRAGELPDPHVEMGGFLNLFGRPQREEPCECERRNDMSLPHALNLVNGPLLADAIAALEGRVAKLILKGSSDRELIDQLYLGGLNRPATSKEYDLALDHLKRSDSRTSGAQDILWAMLNQKAFLFNH
jgi:hypothetical protein